MCKAKRVGVGVTVGVSQSTADVINTWLPTCVDMIMANFGYAFGVVFCHSVDALCISLS